MLLSLGLKVQETHIDKGYDAESEVQKLLDSDVWIYQMPGWWMGEPWIVKEYIDKVFIAGLASFLLTMEDIVIIRLKTMAQVGF